MLVLSSFGLDSCSINAGCVANNSPVCTNATADATRKAKPYMPVASLPK